MYGYNNVNGGQLVPVWILFFLHLVVTGFHSVNQNIKTDCYLYNYDEQTSDVRQRYLVVSVNYQ